MLDSQVQRAQEQLLQLKRQQEQIEKQKRELEELSRKQEDLEKGRGEMIEKLTRSLVVIERETYEAEKRVEQLRLTNATFAQHLDSLERINPKGLEQFGSSQGIEQSIECGGRRPHGIHKIADEN